MLQIGILTHGNKVPYIAPFIIMPFKAPEIRVNAIAPGYVETGFVFPVGGTMAQRVASQNYTGKCVTPEDIASTVIFLCRDGSSITGEEIIVDGGIARLWKK